uniref:Uncharacterized protein n=1 Tax=Amphimedon queenslandica TaxID=400682 RepID=A0A1X7TYY0_AMPQE
MDLAEKGVKTLSQKVEKGVKTFGQKVEKDAKTLGQKVNTDKREIYSKSANFFDTLKIIAYSIDLVKGFAVSFVKIFTTSYIKCVTISDEAGEIAALVIASFILWLIIHILACRKCIEDKEKTETKNDKKGYEISLYGFSNFLMVGAILCYFIGDNLKNFYKIKEQSKSFKMASQILLIIGALGFRYVPIFKGYLYQYFNRDAEEKTKDSEEKTKDSKSNLPGKETIDEVQSFVDSDYKVTKQIVKKSIAQVPEADAIYTLFENIFNNCSNRQIVGTWAALLTIPAVLTPYVGLQLFTIASKIKINRCIPAWTTIFSVLLIILFMVSDNQKALNCLGGTKCVKINDMNELNALNVTCNTAHISDELFNSTSNQIVIGTECQANNIVRFVLNAIQVILVALLLLPILCGKSKKKEGKDKPTAT